MATASEASARCAHLGREAERTIDALKARAQSVEQASWAPSDVRRRVHDWTAQAVRGVIRVTLASYWSVQKRLRFLRAMRRGPHAVWDDAARFAQAARDVDPPTSPVVWASPEDGEAWPLASAIQQTAELVSPHWGPEPSAQDLIDNSWRERIPA